jgi:hypothetical protein
MVTWTYSGSAGQFEDDNSHLRVADGHAAVWAAKPIILGECNVLCLVSGSPRDLEFGLSPAPAPRAKCERSPGPCLTMPVPSWWDEWRPTPNAGHNGGNPHDYDHRNFDESQSRC